MTIERSHHQIMVAEYYKSLEKSRMPDPDHVKKMMVYNHEYYISDKFKDTSQNGIKTTGEQFKNNPIQ